jgi:hypothetical protein
MKRLREVPRLCVEDDDDVCIIPFQEKKIGLTLFLLQNRIRPVSFLKEAVFRSDCRHCVGALCLHLECRNPSY